MSIPQRTALVLIEYQNDFTTDRPALHGAVKGVMDESNMLANTKRVIDEARAAAPTRARPQATAAMQPGR